MHDTSQSLDALNNVFVVYGALRSGTTLLRLMLDAHPEFECPGESDYLFDHVAGTSGAAYTYDKAKLREDRIFQYAEIEGPGNLDGELAFRRMISQLRTRPSGKLALVAHRNLENILGLLPEAPIIHLLRDPRDVARSSIGMGWAGNTYLGVTHWIETERAWDQCAPEARGRRVLELRYETLVRKPEETLQAICEFVGHDVHADMLDYHQSSTYRRPDPSLIEQWRRKQTAQEVGLVEGRIGDLLMARKYAPSGYAVQHPGRIAHAALTLQSKAHVWAFKIRRYGLWNWLLNVIGRRMGINQLALVTQRRINEKENDHLA